MNRVIEGKKNDARSEREGAGALSETGEGEEGRPPGGRVLPEMMFRQEQRVNPRLSAS